MAVKSKIKSAKRTRKKMHLRKRILGTPEKPRLAVFRSARNIYAQLIDDAHNTTLTGVSTLTPTLKADLSKAKNKTEAAKIVGKHLAEKAKENKLEKVVYDRGGFLYHGRVRAVAEGARENGLVF